MIESVEATNISRVFGPLIIILGTALAGFIIAHIVLPLLQKLARRTSWRGDDIFLGVIRSMTMLWFLLLGIYLATLDAPVGSRTAPLIQRTVVIVFILSVTIAAVRLGTKFVTPAIGEAPAGIPALSIIVNVIRIIVFGIGLTVVLQLLNIPVTPALAIFSVGGLALSLAMQETLSNIISGIMIILAGQIRPGNYVKLSTGEEGYVTDINWRTTQIRQITNNMVIVPNSLMTSAILTNFYDPNRELAVLVDVGVGYDSDLEYVEKLSREVAEEVMREVPGGIPEFEPLIRYNTFDDFRVLFTVIVRGQEFVDQFLIKHELVKRLHKRYRQEGIEVAFPIQTIYGRELDRHPVPHKQ